MLEFNKEKVVEIAKHFQFEGELVEIKRWGNGHINDTYCVLCQPKEGD